MVGGRNWIYHRIPFRDGMPDGPTWQRDANGELTYFFNYVFPAAYVPTLCWKAAIPKIQPFRWDEALMQADQRIHFGMAPWMWLQPVIGHTEVCDVDFSFAMSVTRFH